MKATKRLIDSVWTLEYEIVNENCIKILHYDNQDAEGYQKEKQLPRCELEETKDRTVTVVWIKPYVPFEYTMVKDHNARKYEVINPQFVFSYIKEKS
ncbi:hypothetical protein [Flavobacterium sp.]|jgi:hypothetical protein|uniref:hypothetical protein n=1 Tax=Flavobacterium sp. TaxID=239 RepID=UPI0037BF3A61